MGCGSSKQGELSEAVRKDELAKVWSLVEKKANLNEQDETGQTPVYIAASMKETRCLKYLIDHGADVNIADEKGQTVYDIASSDEINKYLDSLHEDPHDGGKN